MGILFYFFIFLFGLCVGSFLNVVILRLRSGQVCSLNEGKGIINGRSHCPKCGHILRWFDLIPLVSFVILRGRCRDCGQPISWQYPLVEITTALLFLLIFNLDIGHWGFIGNWELGIGNFISLGYLLYIVCVLLVVFVYDLRHYIIPDKIIFPAVAVSLVYRFFEIWNFNLGHLLEISNWKLEIFWPFLVFLLAALIPALFFTALIIITKGRGMGWGDVKLVFLMGLMLGWPGILLALLLAFGGGSLVGLSLVAIGQKTMRSSIPFGPFLAAAAIIALFWGPAILGGYSNLF